MRKWPLKAILFSLPLLLAFLTKPVVLFALPAVCKRQTELIPTVEKLRGVEMKSPPTCVVLEGKGFEKAFVDHTARYLEETRVANEGLLLKAFDLIPENFPYEECYFKGSAESVPAFYDGVNHRIVFSREGPVPDRVIVHELVHALQEAAFSIEKVIGKVAGDSDAGLSFAALLEGDAVLVEESFLKENPQQEMVEEELSEQPSNSCIFPESLERLAMVPYELGSVYVATVREQHGQEVLDRLFQNSPSLASSDIFKRTLPVARQVKLSLPDEEEDMTLQYEESLGLFILLEVASVVKGPVVARTLVDDYERDILRFYRSQDGKRIRVDWTIQWGTEAGAQAFTKVFSSSGWKLGALDSEGLSTLFQFEGSAE